MSKSTTNSVGWWTKLKEMSRPVKEFEPSVFAKKLSVLLKSYELHSQSPNIGVVTKHNFTLEEVATTTDIKLKWLKSALAGQIGRPPTVYLDLLSKAFKVENTYWDWLPPEDDAYYPAFVTEYIDYLFKSNLVPDPPAEEGNKLFTFDEVEQAMSKDLPPGTIERLVSGQLIATRQHRLALANFFGVSEDYWHKDLGSTDVKRLHAPGVLEVPKVAPAPAQPQPKMSLETGHPSWSPQYLESHLGWSRMNTEARQSILGIIADVMKQGVEDKQNQQALQADKETFYQIQRFKSVRQSANQQP